MKYALVLVNIKGLGVKTFSYLIPDEMKSIIQIGQAVLVPFGRQGLINAFIVGFSDYLPGDFRAKKINKIIDFRIHPFIFSFLPNSNDLYNLNIFYRYNYKNEISFTLLNFLGKYIPSVSEYNLLISLCTLVFPHNLIMEE